MDACDVDVRRDHLTQIRRTGETAAQTAAIEEPQVLAVSENQEPTVKDLTTYALCYAAVLTAAIAVMGLITSTSGRSGPVAAASAEPPVVVVQADDSHAVATLNIPF